MKLLEAIDNYKKLLKILDGEIPKSGNPPSQGGTFMHEKILMRLAELCYRVDKIDEGLKYLNQLEQ